MLIPFWCLRIVIIQNRMYGHCMAKWLSHIWHIHDGQVTSLCFSAFSVQQKKNICSSILTTVQCTFYVSFRILWHISAIFSHGIWTTAISYYYYFLLKDDQTCHIWSVFHCIKIKMMIIMVIICNMTNIFHILNITEYNVHHEYWIIMYVRI